MAYRYRMSPACYMSAVFLSLRPFCLVLFFFNDTATTEIYTLSLHDALPIFNNALTECLKWGRVNLLCHGRARASFSLTRRGSEEHPSELQSLTSIACRLLLEEEINYGVQFCMDRAGQLAWWGPSCWYTLPLV